MDAGLRRFGRYLLMKQDHEQTLPQLPPKGASPTKPAKTVTFAEVDRSEYPSDWGQVEWEETTSAPTEQCDMMSEDDGL